MEYVTSAADAIAAFVPGIRRETLAGQGHVADPQAFAALLTECYRS